MPTKLSAEEDTVLFRIKMPRSLLKKVRKRSQRYQGGNASKYVRNVLENWMIQQEDAERLGR